MYFSGFSHQVFVFQFCDFFAFRLFSSAVRHSPLNRGHSRSQTQLVRSRLGFKQCSNYLCQDSIKIQALMASVCFLKGFLFRGRLGFQLFLFVFFASCSRGGSVYSRVCAWKTIRHYSMIIARTMCYMRLHPNPTFCTPGTTSKE